MVIREHLCVGCELCKEACVETNNVPEYGFRTTILERRRDIVDGGEETIFMPVLCNQCNRPPCVRVCPTTATWKDETTGIIVMKAQPLYRLQNLYGCLPLQRPLL